MSERADSARNDAARSDPARSDRAWSEVVEELGLGAELDPIERAESWPLYRRYVENGTLEPGARAPAGTVGAGAEIDADGERRRPRRAVAAIAALGGVAALGLWLGAGAKSARFVLAEAHVVAIAALLLLRCARAPWLRVGPAPITRVGRDAWRQFRGGWTGLWIAWLALYVWLALAWSGTGRGLAPTAIWVTADLLNLCGAFAFFYLFLVLDKPSVPARGQPERDRGFRRALATAGGVCVAAGLAGALGRLEVYGWLAGIPRVDAIVVAIAMMYLFARLNSHHMKIRRVMLAPLYLYVAIQLYWPGFAVAEGGATTVLLGAALALKIYVFVVMTRWMGDGTLQRYFDVLAQPQTSADV